MHTTRIVSSGENARLNPVLAEQWAHIRELRNLVTAALEVDRREKRIGSSLESDVTLTTASLAVAGIDMAEVCITSGFGITAGTETSVSTALATGKKCARCWKVLPEVNSRELCLRCDAVVGEV